MMLEKVKEKIDSSPFRSINQIVYDLLYEEIVDLTLAPGYKINEMKLSKETGISRTPIKMSIDRLSNEGLVDKIPGKMSRVALINYKDCMQLCEARKGIEGQAAYLAAKMITKDETLNLKSILQQNTKKGDSTYHVELDCQFHQIIIDASRNKYLIDSYERMESRIRRYRFFIFKAIEENDSDHERVTLMSAGHQSVYYAIERGFSTLARDEIMQDIDMMRYIAKYL